MSHQVSRHAGWVHSLSDHVVERNHLGEPMVRVVEVEIELAVGEGSVTVRLPADEATGLRLGQQVRVDVTFRKADT